MWFIMTSTHFLNRYKKRSKNNLFVDVKLQTANICSQRHLMQNNLHGSLTMTQYSLSSSRQTAVTSFRSAPPRERKKLVWQSWWHVSNFLSVSTRQHGIQGAGATPCGIIWETKIYKMYWSTYGEFWLTLAGWLKKTYKTSTKMQMHVWNWWGTITHCHEANLKAFQIQMHEWKEVCAFSHTSQKMQRDLVSRMHKLRTSGKMHPEKKVNVCDVGSPL